MIFPCLVDGVCMGGLIDVGFVRNANFAKKKQSNTNGCWIFAEKDETTQGSEIFTQQREIENK
jgi:hypothetical protein